MSFADLGIPQLILNALTDSGYTQPTPVQAQAIPAALTGVDLLVSAQTGSGKTAAFMLPVLSKIALRPAELSTKQFTPGPKILVLTPTRELALQVTKAATLYGKYLKRFKVVSVVGGMPYPVQIKQLREPMEVLVATPGRLLDHVQNRKVDLSNVETLVLDEADRMLDMGFIDDIMTVVKALPQTRQTLLFSATLDGVMADIARKLTNNPQRIEISGAKDRHENITQHLHFADDMKHKDALLQHWLRVPELQQAIVFAATKMDTEHLARDLIREGFAAAALHGDMQQRQRNRTLTSLHHGDIQVLVATDVAARGIDVPGISHVINYDLPMKPEDYVHRIGRTGRAGRSGIAISFVSIDDRRRVRAIEHLTGNKIEVSQIPGLEPTKTMPDRLTPSKRGRNGGAGRGSSRGGSGGDYAGRSAPRSGGDRFSADRAPRGDRPAFGADRAPAGEFRARPNNFQRDGLVRDEFAPKRGGRDFGRDGNRDSAPRFQDRFNADAPRRTSRAGGDERFVTRTDNAPRDFSSRDGNRDSRPPRGEFAGRSDRPSFGARDGARDSRPPRGEFVGRSDRPSFGARDGNRDSRPARSGAPSGDRSQHRSGADGAAKRRARPSW